MFLTSTGLLFALVIVFDKQIMCDLKVCSFATLSAHILNGAHTPRLSVVSISLLLYHSGFI